MDDDEYTSCRLMFLDEIELLKAMFSNDELILPEGEQTLADGRDTMIILRLTIDDESVEVVIQCGLGYPLQSKPSVLVRCNSVHDAKLNQQIRTFVDDEQPLGEPLIMSIIQWLQENFANFKRDVDCEPAESSNTVEQHQKTTKEETYARYWIYSHHLRSNVKRRNIELIAKSLQLNGFSSPGKPGIIVVEGAMKKCKEFWEQIHAWNWKHITVRHIEESPTSEGFQCLEKFKEIIFATNDGRRIELADVKNYLSQFGLEYGFSILLNMLSSSIQ